MTFDQNLVVNWGGPGAEKIEENSNSKLNRIAVIARIGAIQGDCRGVGQTVAGQCAAQVHDLDLRFMV